MPVGSSKRLANIIRLNRGVLNLPYVTGQVVPPVLSFSLGSLGFLTKFSFEDHPKTLSRVFGEEGVTVGLRVRFEGTCLNLFSSLP
jgi:NAD+ kinase